MSRSAGRSATASAAYRSGEKLHDLRTGLTYDYSKRSGVMLSAVILPDGGSANREQLWNAVEQAEKRVNSVVAREIVVALPHELSSEQQQALVKDYAQGLSERTGWGVDVAIHAPGREGDLRNVHAHLLCTTRNVSRDPSGLPVMNQKTREWDIRSSGSELIRSERSEWERCVNVSLEQAHEIARVDCRSHAERGTGLEPQIHLGVAAMGMERKGIQTQRGDIHRGIEAHNAKVIDLAQVREEKAEAQSWEQELNRLDTLPIEQHRAAVKALRPSRLETLIAGHPQVKATEQALALERAQVAKWSEAFAQSSKQADRVLSDYDYEHRFHPKMLKAVEQGFWMNQRIDGILNQQEGLKQWFVEHQEPYVAKVSQFNQQEQALDALKNSLKPWAKTQQLAQLTRFNEAYELLLKAEAGVYAKEIEHLERLPYGEMRQAVEGQRYVPSLENVSSEHPLVSQVPISGEPHHSQEQKLVWDASASVRSARRWREEWCQKHPVKTFLHETGVKAPALVLQDAQIRYLEGEEKKAEQALLKLEKQAQGRQEERSLAFQQSAYQSQAKHMQMSRFQAEVKAVLERRNLREPEQLKQWEHARAQERGRGGGRGM
jgi:isopentenyldiphosphate isomerase